MAPRLSVVVPNLDSPLVGATLAALAAQQVAPGDLEVLVVGRDAPGQVPREPALPGGVPLRFLASAEPLNPAAARNRGVAAARGERLLFTDADCRPVPGWAAALDAALDRSPVAGGAVTFPREGNRWALADNIACFHELLADRPADDASRLPLGSLNLATRREAWDAVGPFDETLPTSEDFDWVLRARAAGLATAFVPAALVEHASVRGSAASLAGHATWYGRHFSAFRAKHPGVLGTGLTWRHRRLLALTAPLKATVAAAQIFLAHRQLRSSWRAFPGVVAFKRAWYRAVLDHWQAAP